MAIKSFSKISPQADILFPDDGKLKFGAGEDFEIYHQDSVPVNVITSNTADILFLQNLNDGDIKFSCDDGSNGVATYLSMDGGLGYSFVNRNIRFNDDVEAAFGTGNDLLIYHNGTHSNIGNYVGDLLIFNHTDDGDVIFQCDDGSGGVTAYLTLDGSAGTIEVAKTTRLADSVSLKLGSATDLELFHDGTNSFINNNTGPMFIRQNVDDGDIRLQSDNGSGGVTDYLTLDGSQVQTIFNVNAQFQDDVRLKVGSGGDIQIKHDGSNSSISNATGNLTVSNSADDADIIFKSDDGSGGTTAYLTLDGSTTQNLVHKDLRFDDNIGAVFGSGAALKLHSDGSNGIIDNFQGNLIIRQQVDNADIVFQSDDGSGGVATYFFLDGSQATAGGTLFTKWGDNSYISLGDGSDCYIFHNGTDTSIANSTGDLIITNSTDDGDIIFQSDDGSGGVTTYFQLDGGEGRTVFKQNALWEDGKAIYIGNAADLRMQHTGNQSYIQNYTGDFHIQNTADDKDIIFYCDDGSGGVEEYFRLDGSAGGAAPVTKFPDGSRLQFGGGGDANMNHDGTNFTFSVVTGDLRVKCDTDDGNLKLQCDDGSGGAANYLVLDGGDKTLIAEVPLILEADSTVGWHGSVTRVKILPRDFQADNSGRPALTVIDTNVAHLASNASSNLFASIPIPTGFKATHVKIHGSDTGQTFTVKEANIANKTTATKGTATALETEKAITNVNSTTTNYILIQVSSNGTADEIHGGYMTIAAI